MENFILEEAEKAFAKHQFQAYFQPIYNHSTGEVIGAEALVRWIHPQRGMIPPFQFIRPFEEAGMIGQLDLFIFEDVCKFLKDCIKNEIKVVPVSVNLSKCDAYKDEFLKSFESIRKKHKVPVEYLRIEITESLISVGKFEAQKTIKALHDMGYTVALDDYGAGSLSFNILRDLDYDIIKLDMNFAADGIDGKNGVILGSMVRMAKDIGVSVIAEGVEKKDLADFLLGVGCENIQGYLYSQPIPRNAFKELLVKSAQGEVKAPVEEEPAANALKLNDPSSMDSLLFSNFVGAAAMFQQLADGSVEMLRVNRNYAKLLEKPEKNILAADPLRAVPKEDRPAFLGTLEAAVKGRNIEECDVHIGKKFVNRRIVLIGKNGQALIFFEQITSKETEEQ